MLSFERAREVILERVTPRGTEKLPVRETGGRVLAEHVCTPFDFPSARLSAVDGYALCFGDSETYRVVGVTAAGQSSALSLKPGQCVAVMTGGVVPDGTDCVVKVEQAETLDDTVRVHSLPERGDLINGVGSEAKAGARVLGPGVRLTNVHYPLLFHAGISETEVFSPPRVGMLVTGGELREVEDAPMAGTVYNTNQYILESFLCSIGLTCEQTIRVGEGDGPTRDALDELAAHCDIVVSSGGVSMGRYDHLKKAFQESHFDLLVNQTAIKPGRPLMVAERRGTLYFGMPGYPAAFLTNALLYLVPALKKACGRSDYHHRWISEIGRAHV